MKFKEALKKAGVQNPGRTTWCRELADGTAVFTFWWDEIHRVDGRLFAWWGHAGNPGPDKELDQLQKGKATRFLALAKKNLGKKCRAVILHRNPKTGGVESADYPHLRMARADFRHVDDVALQFIVELLPLE